MHNHHIGFQFFADAGTLVNTTAGDVTSGTATADGSFSAGMKTYYDTELLENARSKLIYAQLGKKQILPANHGETVEWRKWNTFEKATAPLTEGVIPTGKKFGQSAVNVSVKQYGDYAAVSDRLDLHNVDNVILGAAEEMGAAGGETADILIRNELVTGTNVLYADTVSGGTVTGTPAGRWEMTGAGNKLTADTVNRAFTLLKKAKAPFFEGNKYVAVIHPSVSYDLRSDSGWLEAHKYGEQSEIFEGEIGELHGVRFIESTNAPVFRGGNLFGGTAALTVNTYGTSDTTAAAEYGVATTHVIDVDETLTAAQAEALVGRRVNLSKSGSVKGTMTVVGCTKGAKNTNKLWLDPNTALTGDNAPADGDALQPGEGAGDGGAVYGTLFFGKDAFGVVEPEGMGMELIVHTADTIGGPLNQFSTVGYKFESAAKILYQDRMVRVESCSAYSDIDEAN